MRLDTALTDLLGIDCPVLLAPMDLVSDARLTAAVTAAGGLGILGGGYGDRTWLARELDALLAKFGPQDRQQAFDCGIDGDLAGKDRGHRI